MSDLVRRNLCHPVALAGVLTLVNAVKPPVVDDTAYLLLARHAAGHPLDPYGFDLFWWDEPQPAFTILAPPVVPCWLAVGIALFGEQLLLLKLWLFPFALIFAFAARTLVHRVVGPVPMVVALLVIGPGVLPFGNFMLDIPALSLQLGCLAALETARSRRSIVWTGLAGLLLGLAVETKYSVLGLPAVIGWWGYCRGGTRRTVVVILVGGLLMIGCETLIIWLYGRSHFLEHVGRQSGEGKWDQMARLPLPLIAHLGATAPVLGLLAVSTLQLPRWGVTLLLFGVVSAWGTVAFVPVPWADFAPALFIVLGTGSAVAILSTVIVIGFSRRRQQSFVSRTLVAFVIGWLAIELTSYFVLSPFPAARRVLGVSWIGTLIVCRHWVRVSRTDHRIGDDRLLPFGVVLGLFLTGLDVWDAQPERAIAERASAYIQQQNSSGRAFFVGHWGFQYFCDRAGMKLVDPGRTCLLRGDWLLLPTLPDDVGFYRPYHGLANITADPQFVSLVQEFVWEDVVWAQTIPNLYGGKHPVVTRQHPRLRVGLYRVTADWTPPRQKR